MKKFRYNIFIFCILGALSFNPAIGASNKKITVADLQRFTTVIEHIKSYYVDSIKDAELLENAIRGMLAGLDPHSSYLDQEEFADLKVNTSGKFGGLGIEVTLEDGFIKVITPIDDTPAAKAGIKSGDLIVRLNDSPVKGFSLREAVEVMRGKPGTDIMLSIIRVGADQPLKIKVKRDIIKVKSVKTKMLEQGYGYARVSQFQNDTAEHLKKSLNKMMQNNKLKGLVLDLRNNPGGVLHSSVQISNLFLNKSLLKHDGIIVYTKGRLKNSQVKEHATAKDLLQDLPLIVLVNEGSASASEIVAGALQDHKRAIILGTKTFGKGSVQTILPLKDNRGLKLTTALYYTPSGRSIQATGITPDIIVENIKIPTQNDPNRDFLLLKESDLQRHISNQDKSNSQTAEKTDLIHQDYQLYQALNTLKSLNVLLNN